MSQATNGSRPIDEEQVASSESGPQSVAAPKPRRSATLLGVPAPSSPSLSPATSSTGAPNSEALSEVTPSTSSPSPSLAMSEMRPPMASYVGLISSSPLPPAHIPSAKLDREASRYSSRADLEAVAPSVAPSVEPASTRQRRYVSVEYLEAAKSNVASPPKAPATSSSQSKSQVASPPKAPATSPSQAPRSSRTPRVPRMLVPLSSVDIASLDRREASLIARVDGLTSEAELLEITAWSSEQLAEVLARLVRMKLVSFR